MSESNNRISLQNRCGESKSPYVRSHLDNPTAWQLWTPETLKLAKKTNRLLFVSIGYSACHWCHVMAHESFDDPRIAQLLNENFIPIKIDREERPDIDRQYMDFLQATNGGGGWPLNVFVTPDLEPIFGGTYWPGPNSERARQAGSGFQDILTKVSTAWREQEQRCRDSAKEITRQLREFAQEGSIGGKDGDRTDDHDELELDLLDDAFQHYKMRYDDKHGGFGGAPKFPTPVHIRPLLRVASYPATVREIVGEDECIEARSMAVTTLEKMAKGGIKDQIGHGFARYSVTRDWSLPHFEKMLYDNAQLLPVYLDAYLLTKSPLFLDTVHDIATYLTSAPMQSELGGIHSAEDADSLPNAIDTHKCEGAYYVWTLEEFTKVLSEEELKVCAKYWNVKAEGNVDRRHDAQGELIKQNTLCVSYELADLASELGLAEDAVKKVLESGKQKLLAYRNENRPRPALDDKIVTSWNGLAIGGLARASGALRETSPDAASKYLSAAIKAVTCIEKNLFDAEKGTLRRVYREGPGETQGFADDYAFFISGLLDLYETTFDSNFLKFADTLQKTQNELFWDETKYGFFSTPANQPDILIRTKDAMDNAEPSVNGVSASNLFRLGSLLNDESYSKMARRTVACFEVEIEQHPGLFSGILSSVVASRLGVKGVMVVGDGEAARAVLKNARERVRPNYTIVRIGGGANSEWLRSRNELVKDLDENRDMVQLCEGQSCRLLNLQQIEEELF
ncbi:Putative spermatogenesis-associated protein [Septoria linicola]|uniref:Spermatogenesis-associated protein n=1 Tax=Septoria linicola TaxID=215465 RepID=A0A9Q9EGS7_9PEZI|nr:Putative spermatogenesis-associated protein [Septoria linicola]